MREATGRDAEIWDVFQVAWTQCIDVIDAIESSGKSVEEIVQDFVRWPVQANGVGVVVRALDEARYPRVYEAVRRWRALSVDDVPHRLMRQDDNGHEFEVGVFASKNEAVLEEQRLARRMHKQHYWVEVVE